MAEAVEVVEVVRFDERAATGAYRVGFAELNVERALNALNLQMIRMLDAQLRRWADDPRIACVVLSGAGAKAFCAGGDVRSLREAILAHGDKPAPNPYAQDFFGDEYRLDFLLHTFPKPVLIWGSGIVMGGGLGLLVSGSHRVVTDTSRIAMPEISIGLYPDVGGSWFLRRMPKRTGLFLALTGASLNGADAIDLGLADVFLASSDKEAVFAALASAPWGGDAAHNRVVLSRLLRPFAERARDLLPVGQVHAHAQEIDRLTDADTLPELVERITAYHGDDAWLKKAAATLAAGSPTTAALSWALWHRVRHMSLADVFRLELIVSIQCCAHPDLPEGVRALLVDKDNRPAWTPKSIAEVTPAWVEEHFAAPWLATEDPSRSLADLGEI